MLLSGSRSHLSCLALLLLAHSLALSFFAFILSVVPSGDHVLPVGAPIRNGSLQPHDLLPQRFHLQKLAVDRNPPDPLSLRHWASLLGRFPLHRRHLREGLPPYSLSDGHVCDAGGACGGDDDGAFPDAWIVPSRRADGWGFHSLWHCGAGARRGGRQSLTRCCDSCARFCGRRRCGDGLDRYGL